MFFILLPYEVDIAQDRDPYLNRVLIAVTIAMFFLTIGTLNFIFENAGPKWVPGDSFPENLIAYGFRPLGLAGCALLHAGFMHLLSNMLFLWLFGNAICSKIGNILYIPVYFLLAFMASYIAAVDGKGGIGASGAINGLVGMYLVFFPLNNISCFVFAYGRFRVFFNTFYLSSFWMVLYWLAFDIGGLILSPDSKVGHVAHIGGFVSGVGLGVFMLLTGIVKEEKSEKSLLQVFGFRKKKEIKLTLSSDIADMVKNKGVSLKKYMITDSDENENAESIRSERNSDIEEDIDPETLFTVFQKDINAENKKTKKKYICISCECGKRLKIPVGFAKKKGRCPQCNNVIHIPKLSV